MTTAVTAKDEGPGSLAEGAVDLSDDDRAALATAVRLLEHTSLAARVTTLLGRQFEMAGSLIPERMSRLVSHATTRALQAALRVAFHSLRPEQRPASSRLHQALTAATGAAGGAFGAAALPFELPISTTLILRSIADIARSEGEDLARPEAALACLQVFALGGRTGGDGHIEGGYFAVRSLMARTLGEAARLVVERGVVDEAAPVLLRFVSMIATRFGVVVSQKLAAQAVPVVGALSGAALNYAFTDHFQGLARGHFIVRRLERQYGSETVRAAYAALQGLDATV